MHFCKITLKSQDEISPLDLFINLLLRVIIILRKLKRFCFQFIIKQLAFIDTNKLEQNLFYNGFRNHEYVLNF